MTFGKAVHGENGGEMRFVKALLVFLIAILPLAFVTAVIFFPGPHRLVVPRAFGLTMVAPGVFSDAPERADQLVGLVTQADASTADFFGETHPRWRTILCATQDCREDFGIPGRAITIADFAILTAPSGVTANTLLHEQVHIELNARMGPLDAIWPRFPSWFNEGLATYLSGTPAVPGPERVSEAQWITAAKTPLGWRMVKRGRSAAEYYGAARRMVAEIDRELGRDGLRDLVRAVADGADFGAELSARLGR